MSGANVEKSVFLVTWLFGDRRLHGTFWFQPHTWHRWNSKSGDPYFGHKKFGLPVRSFTQSCLWNGHSRDLVSETRRLSLRRPCSSIIQCAVEWSAESGRFETAPSPSVSSFRIGWFISMEVAFTNASVSATKPRVTYSRISSILAIVRCRFFSNTSTLAGLQAFYSQY